MAQVSDIEVLVTPADSLLTSVEKFAASVTRLQKLLAMQAANEVACREGKLFPYTEDDFLDLEE